MITRIRIGEVGPLTNLDLRLGKANLIIGMNESGKTTLTDLLAFKLQECTEGKIQSKEFQKITGLLPERFGGKWKAEIEGCIDSIPDDSLTKDAFVDILSLLVVRANRNEVSNKHKDDVASLGFWKSTVRNMLSGTSLISKKIESIKEYTKPGARIWKIREHLETYCTLLRKKKLELDAFKTSIQASLDDGEHLKSIDAKLEGAKKARDAQEFSRRRALYGKYMERISAISLLEQDTRRIDISQLEKKAGLWNEAEGTLRAREKGSSDIRVEREKKEEALRGIEKAITLNRERRDEFRKYADSKKEVPVAGTSGSGGEREKLETERARALTLKKRIPLLPLIIAGIGLVSLGCAYFWMPMVYVSGAAIVFGIVLFAVLKLKIDHEASDCIALAEKAIMELDLRFQAGKIVAESEMKQLGQYQAEIGKIEAAMERDAADARELDIQIAKFRSESLNLDTEIESLKKNISALEKEHGDRTSLGSIISESKSKQERLVSLKSELTNIENEIKTSFGVTDIIPADLLARLDLEKRSVSEDYVSKSSDPKMYDSLLRERRAIVEKGHNFDKEFAEMKGTAVAELESALAKARESSSAAMFVFYNLFFASIVETLRVDSVYDLEAAIVRCTDALAKIGRYFEYAEYLNGLVTALESKQEALIRSVIGEEGFRRNIARLLSYPKVDVSIEDTSVVFSFGEKGFTLADLSTGAIHQFNLALRFSLVKRIFKGPSTLILDDAFLHFDFERRKRACEILLDDFVKEGWQFIYTAIDDRSIEPVFRSVFPEKDLNIVRI